jgi:hypothetical protein
VSAWSLSAEPPAPVRRGEWSPHWQVPVALARRRAPRRQPAVASFREVVLSEPVVPPRARAWARQPVRTPEPAQRRQPVAKSFQEPLPEPVMVPLQRAMARARRRVVESFQEAPPPPERAAFRRAVSWARQPVRELGLVQQRQPAVDCFQEPLPQAPQIVFRLAQRQREEDLLAPRSLPGPLVPVREWEVSPRWPAALDWLAGFAACPTRSSFASTPRARRLGPGCLARGRRGNPPKKPLRRLLTTSWKFA